MGEQSDYNNAYERYAALGSNSFNNNYRQYETPNALARLGATPEQLAKMGEPAPRVYRRPGPFTKGEYNAFHGRAKELFGLSAGEVEAAQARQAAQELQALQALQAPKKRKGFFWGGKKARKTRRKQLKKKQTRKRK